MERTAPDHRLTIWARRSLAAYDSDTAESLTCIDKLLALYPGDANLRLARLSLPPDSFAARSGWRFSKRSVTKRALTQSSGNSTQGSSTTTPASTPAAVSACCGGHCVSGAPVEHLPRPGRAVLGSAPLRRGHTALSLCRLPRGQERGPGPHLVHRLATISSRRRASWSTCATSSSVLENARASRRGCSSGHMSRSSSPKRDSKCSTRPSCFDRTTGSCSSLPPAHRAHRGRFERALQLLEEARKNAPDRLAADGGIDRGAPRAVARGAGHVAGGQRGRADGDGRPP